MEKLDFYSNTGNLKMEYELHPQKPYREVHDKINEIVDWINENRPMTDTIEDAAERAKRMMNIPTAQRFADLKKIGE